MGRWLMIGLAAAAAATALWPAAAAADQSGGGGGRTTHFGPFDSSSPDSGTCGNNWASDTFKRQFFVEQTGATTFQVTEDFVDGRFVTMAGASPGACETSTPHGTAVAAGVRGEFNGFLTGTVTSTTYNPDACKTTPTACGSTAGFVAAVFGPAADYTCETGSGPCSFFFRYNAPAENLAFRDWVNASPDLGGNQGDVATT